MPEVRRRSHRDPAEEEGWQDLLRMLELEQRDHQVDFKLWQKPILEDCPQCAAKFLVYGGSRAKPMIVCADKQCGYKRSAEPVGEGDTVAEPLVASAMVAPAT